MTPSANRSISGVPLIWHNFLKMVKFSFHLLESLVAWIPCLPLHSLALTVIMIFHFRRYYQISLLITVNSWFLVPRIFISYDRAVMLSMRMKTDISSLSFNVKNIIANLAALSSKTFMWDFRSSTDHGHPVVWHFQLDPQPCNDASEFIIWGRGEIKNLLQSQIFFPP